MFSRIVPRYDLLNHLLTFRLDERWRKLTVRCCAVQPGERVLDVCAGTGDLALAFARHSEAERVVATDFCPEMLARLPGKASRAGEADRIGISAADCLRLPFPDASFDVVSAAFGIRNVVDPAAGIAEMTRVLAPGGRLAVLECDVPKNRLARTGFRAYWLAIPLVVRMFCGKNAGAYRYLNESVERFARTVDLRATFGDCGLVDVRRESLTTGVAQLVTGCKPRRDEARP